MADLTELEQQLLNKLLKRLALNNGFTENALVADVGSQIGAATTATADAALTGAKPATVANVNTVPGLPGVFRVLVPSGANGNVDVVVSRKVRVIDAWFVMKGAGTAGSTLRVTNGTGANHVTEAFDASALVDTSKRSWATIDDANHEIAAAGTLRLTKASTGGDFPGAEAYVAVLPVA